MTRDKKSVSINEVGVGVFVLATVVALLAVESVDEARAIRPYDANPRYWQYAGNPVMLLGGSREDNLFQIPDLERHLDLLASAGGNYVRNTMSSRDEGNVWPFGREGTLFDLDGWDDRYWIRFDDLLRMTDERGIIVQIELWAFWDFFNVWETSPWNPDNNVNYGTADTQLRSEPYPRPRYRNGETFGEPHRFFLTVPGIRNDVRVLQYQQRFIDKVLEHTLVHDHVLYCVTNEIHEPHPLEWSTYWIDYVRERARRAGRRVYLTEMFWAFDFSHDQHRPALEKPARFDYFEASQNSAINDPEENWKNLQYAFRRLAGFPRPINHTKMYGADGGPAWAGTTEDVLQQFWRNIVGGAASSRFHRPPAGIGLSDIARRHLRSARTLSERLDLFRCEPDAEHSLLAERSWNEAYLCRDEGRQYAVYFPDGGSVLLDLEAVQGVFTLAWLEIGPGRWRAAPTLGGGSQVELSPPGEGPWVALLTREKGGSDR